MSWLLGAGVLALLAYCLYVTVLVLRGRFYEPAQKTAQCALIWMLPVLGVVLVHWLNRYALADFGRVDTDFIPEQHRVGGG